MYWYFTLFTVTFSMYAQELALLCCLYQTVWERSSLTHKSLNFITPSFSLLSLTLACSRCQSASLSESHQSSAHRCDTWECCVISLTAISHWYWAYNFGEHYAHPNHMNASHYFIALLSWLRDERLFLKLELKKKKDGYIMTLSSVAWHSHHKTTVVTCPSRSKARQATPCVCTSFRMDTVWTV